MIPVFYNLGLILIVLSIFPISNSNIVLTKLIPEIREHVYIVKKKFYGARNTKSLMMRTPSLLLPDLFGRENIISGKMIIQTILCKQLFNFDLLYFL